jgi:hypothetical protein
MKLVLPVILLIIACGHETNQDKYLNDFLAEHPNVNMIGLIGDEQTCWIEDGNPTRHLMLTPNLSEEEVHAAAKECLRLGAPINE